MDHPIIYFDPTLSVTHEQSLELIHSTSHYQPSPRRVENIIVKATTDIPNTDPTLTRFHDIKIHEGSTDAL
jgi:hypothetical protein